MHFYEDDQGSRLPLCLDCSAKFQQLQQSRLEQLFRIHNYHSSQFDMVTGIPSPKFDIPTPAGQVHMNHINIGTANIGVLNTGSIGSLDLAIGHLGESGETQPATALRQIVEAVLRSEELSDAQKREVVDSLSLVAHEATLPEAQRRKTPMLALIAHTATIVSGAAGLAQLWEQLGPVIEALFR